MEEAVTDQIIKTTKEQIEPQMRALNEMQGETGAYQEVARPINLDDQTEILPQVDENIIDIQTNVVEEVPAPQQQESPRQNPKGALKKQDIVGWKLEEKDFKTEVGKYLDRLDNV